MLNTTMIWALVVGLLVGALLDVFHNWRAAEGDKTSSAAVRTIARSLIGGILAVVVTVCIGVTTRLDDLSEFNRSMAYVSKSFSAYRSILDIHDENLRSVVLDGLDGLVTKIGDIDEKSTLFITKDQDLLIWVDMIIGAQEVTATNLVSADDFWSYVNPDDAGLHTQKQAIADGTDIRRIFIYDPDTPGHKEGHLHLAELQEAIGIKVKLVSLEYITDNPKYTRAREALLDLDVVLVDDKLVMLTKVSTEFEVEWSLLKWDQATIDAAGDFLGSLWEDGKTLSEMNGEANKGP